MTRSLDRRALLKLALLLSSTPLIGACDSAAPSTTPPVQGDQEIDILVVGAGAAGLGAARLLHQQGYRVIVLEGRERIGGRVWTSQDWPTIPLDMGASWIQGSEGNPLTALTDAFDIETVATDTETIVVYDPEGFEFSEEELKEAEEGLNAIIEAVEALVEELDEEEVLNLSVQGALDRILPEMDLDEEEVDELGFLLSTTIEYEYAADMADLSLLALDEGGLFGGEDRLFPGGYAQLMEGLARELDVRLGHVVKQITHDSSGVSVTTDQGRFTARQAVITLPLGVLQQGTVAFSPPLPAPKQAAIQALGMGVLDKVYLRFPEQFWPTEPDWLGYVSGQQGAWAAFVNTAKFVGAPVLMAFNSGSYARRLESRPDQEIVAEMMEVLRTIYGAAIPDPEAWQISRWGADPFAGGAYSYLPPGVTSDLRDLLAEPVDDRLFFAGEATFRAAPSTVHGALLSGEHAARLITQRRTQ